MREVRGRHGAIADFRANGFPEANLAVFERGVELVDADTGGGGIGVMAHHAIAIKEGLDEVVKSGGIGAGSGGGFEGSGARRPEEKSGGRKRQNSQGFQASAVLEKSMKVPAYPASISEG